MQRDLKLVCTGIGGTALAALCCFTPILVIAFTAVGLGVAVAYLDYVLLPALAFFLGLTLFAGWRITRQRSASNSSGQQPGEAEDDGH